MEFKKFNAPAVTTTPPTQSEETDTNTIDRVMRLDPLHMNTQDLDTIIKYYRAARALFESGQKPKKGFNAAGEKVDLSASLAALGVKKPEEPKPSPSGGLRRI